MLVFKLAASPDGCSNEISFNIDKPSTVILIDGLDGDGVPVLRIINSGVDGAVSVSKFECYPAPISCERVPKRAKFSNK